MTTDINQLWLKDDASQLVEVLIDIDNKIDMQNFLRDVMTEKEIVEISARLQAAKMLQNGSTYADIVKATKLSTRTVARISDWLQNGTGGYARVLKTIEAHHNHTSPARA